MTGALLASAALSAVPAHAQGSSVMTHSSCATAMGAAGVANPCRDGSAVLFNPAALALQPSVIGIGATAITTSGGFTADFTGERFDRDSETRPVPFGFASYRVNEALALGVGAFAPYGLGIRWGEGDEIDDFPGRFAAFDTELRNIYIQPTVAVALAPWISVGAGLDFVIADINIQQRVDLSRTNTPSPNPLTGLPLSFGELGVPAGTDFANAELDGSGTAVTFHAGLKVRLAKNLDFGFRYLAPAEIDYEGDATFTQIPTGLVIPPSRPASPLNPTANPLPLDIVLAQQFADGAPLATGQTLATTLTLPRQAVVGFAFRPVPMLQLLADYQFTGWESFRSAQIEFENQTTPTPLILDYQNTDTYRAGAELAPTDALRLRAGFIYNTAAERSASVSPLLPEAERNYYSAGIGYQLRNGLGIDVGYQYIDQSDRRGRIVGRSSFAQTAAQLNTGVFDADASLFNVTLHYSFGGFRGMAASPFN